ncbi:hypothetical protein F5J12DRAFT_783249 [Pisolithus orientalis]|uniref:uncharacterized protein n=1 Tax=Pisolithus orientalis TaxID=936130 RepID=UPI0022254AC2|nr:uncharacterized protein F5J12DRAFT_783249 [Pisolithus orientalis]KAI6005206.1 hypothetical protein F5J12DRAFT_783249 [Pisolithus orientalis]
MSMLYLVLTSSSISLLLNLLLPLRNSANHMVSSTWKKSSVITGFAKVSPWHSSWTQQEMEAHGEFTIEGCINMAWIMGSIKHFDSHLKDGTLHVGWVDTKTGEPVDDKDIRSQYEKEILSHASVCLIGAYLSFPCDLLLNLKCRFPELFCGYDPKKVFNQEIELIHD